VSQAPEDPLLELGIAFLLIGLNGLFALSELSIVSARKARLKTMADSGRAGAATANDVRLLQEAQAEGVRAADAIAAEYGRGDARRTARAAAYLRDNVKYGIGPDEVRGLQLFLDYAADLGLAPARRKLEFF